MKSKLTKMLSVHQETVSLVAYEYPNHFFPTVSAFNAILTVMPYNSSEVWSFE